MSSFKSPYIDSNESRELEFFSTMAIINEIAKRSKGFVLIAYGLPDKEAERDPDSPKVLAMMSPAKGSIDPIALLQVGASMIKTSIEKAIENGEIDANHFKDLDEELGSA